MAHFILCRHQFVPLVEVEVNHEYEDIEAEGADTTEEDLTNTRSSSTTGCVQINCSIIQSEGMDDSVRGRAPEVAISHTLGCAGQHNFGSMQDHCARIYDVSNSNRNRTFVAATNGHYEWVPSVDVVQAGGGHNCEGPTALSATGCRGTAVREQVKICMPSGAYERAQVYERVPDVIIDEILSNTQIYEQAPNVSVAQILLEVSNSLEGMSGYERIHYDEKTLQLVRGVIQPYERISGYERVRYGGTLEQMLRRRL
jgi:hypothetical protein